MEYLTIVGTVALVHLLGLIGPGPDLILAIRNSLRYSRKTGIMTAVGFGLGMVVHLLYCVLGLAFVISKSILLFNVIKICGGLYLIYIGIVSLRTKSSKIELSEKRGGADISSFAAIRMGFLTNVLNPKVTLFFLSLFTFVLSADTPNSVVGVAGALMIINTILWFSIVAIVMTHRHTQAVFSRSQDAINKFFGVVLVGLGVKVALLKK